MRAVGRTMSEQITPTGTEAPEPNPTKILPIILRLSNQLERRLVSVCLRCCLVSYCSFGSCVVMSLQLEIELEIYGKAYWCFINEASFGILGISISYRIVFLASIRFLFICFSYEQIDRFD